MTDKTLTKTRIRNGIWEGVLTGMDAKPDLEVILLGEAIDGISVDPVKGESAQWAVRVPVPTTALTEGVQTFLIREKGASEALTHFTIITGVAMEDDLRAEVDLLRQELDMLKRAFRRHCLETAG